MSGVQYNLSSRVPLSSSRPPSPYPVLRSPSKSSTPSPSPRSRRQGQELNSERNGLFQCVGARGGGARGGRCRRRRVGREASEPHRQLLHLVARQAAASAARADRSPSWSDRHPASSSASVGSAAGSSCSTALGDCDVRGRGRAHPLGRASAAAFVVPPRRNRGLLGRISTSLSACLPLDGS